MDYLEESHTINGAYYAKAAASGDCEEKKRKVDSKCSALEDNALAHT